MDYITDIQNEINEKLVSVGYELVETDTFLLNESIEKIKEYICNKTNQEKVPLGLKYVWIDRVVAQFLRFKIALGKLDINGLNFERIAKEISEGDIKIVYNDTVTSGERLEGYLKELENKGENEFLKYRRLLW